MQDLRVTHRQIEAFRALMLTGSMTEAAQMLYVTQPAVSKIIAQLESELGFSLFERRHGKVAPTEEGHILYSEVEHSYSGLERVVRAARRIKKRTGGSLRLAVMPALSIGFMIEVVRRFIEHDNELSLSIQAFGSEDIVDVISSGLYDAGFSMTPVNTTRVDSSPVMSIPYFCILPPDHPLREKDVVSVTDLENERYVTISETSPTRLRIDSLFSSMNVTRAVMIEARWSLSIAELVQAGLGCSIVDGFTASSFASRGGLVRPLKEHLDFSFVYVTRQMTARSTTLLRFLSQFESEFDTFRARLSKGIVL
ncbi:LysR substrate-binding domain-containing protein [Sinorhizobium meliloti]|uniref:LysR substrate-binding domain-containing protein n=1 Tax=Rhizobium meliloti TaxID=382 RepID=UPI0003DB95E9|nr:LysR substrate-binding domain-containing protein [Sinorhizobium meliloti]ARS71040.1 hypothetical protein SMRU11_29215 [Sinorhizobium meliloti RU11/001]